MANSSTGNDFYSITIDLRKERKKYENTGELDEGRIKEIFTRPIIRKPLSFDPPLPSEDVLPTMRQGVSKMLEFLDIEFDARSMDILVSVVERRIRNMCNQMRVLQRRKRNGLPIAFRTPINQVYENFGIKGPLVVKEEYEKRVVGNLRTQMKEWNDILSRKGYKKNVETKAEEEEDEEEMDEEDEEMEEDEGEGDHLGKEEDSESAGENAEDALQDQSDDDRREMEAQEIPSTSSSNRREMRQKEKKESGKRKRPAAVEEVSSDERLQKRRLLD